MAFHIFKGNAAKGNCGMEFYRFYCPFDYAANKSIHDKFSYKLLAEILGKKRALDSLIAFSGNKQQDKDTFGPHAFARWLKKQKEKVYASPWTPNYNTRAHIKAYFWIPSLKFRREVAAEQARMKTVNELYHQDHYY